MSSKNSPRNSTSAWRFRAEARSRISIDAWGAGDCNARLWEIVANKSLLLYQKYNILFPNKFQNNKHAGEFSTMEEFKSLFRHYLKEKEESINVANNGYKHLMDFHTAEKRVEKLIDSIV